MQAQPGGVKFLNPTLTVFISPRNSATSRLVCPAFQSLEPSAQFAGRTTYCYHARSTSTMSMGKREIFFYLGIGHWSLVIGHWSLVIGHWSLVIGHPSLVIGHWPLAEPPWESLVLPHAERGDYG